jgi:hypothetical protein
MTPLSAEQSRTADSVSVSSTVCRSKVDRLTVLGAIVGIHRQLRAAMVVSIWVLAIAGVVVVAVVAFDVPWVKA